VKLTAVNLRLRDGRLPIEKTFSFESGFSKGTSDVQKYRVELLGCKLRAKRWDIADSAFDIL
jgi:hypothetical protein